MSVHQLVVYHSVVLVYKVITTKSPKYLYEMFSKEYMYKTKQADSGQLRQTRAARDMGLELSQDSFRWRAAKSFNEPPTNIINLATTEAFKQEAKVWIKLNISLYPDWAWSIEASHVGLGTS